MHSRPPSAPRYVVVAGLLRDAIIAGRHPLGSSLPSERQLMEAHGIARGTARHAISLLVEEGTAAVRRGAQAVVIAAPPPPEQTLSELLSFSAWARSLGCEPSGRVIALSRRTATPDDTAALALGADEPVWDLTRVRMLDGRAVMIERSTYPHRIGQIVAALDLERVSITSALLDHDMHLARARHTIDARPASADDASLLGVDEGAPLLRVRRLATSPLGEPLERGEDRYLGDAVAFSVDNVARQASTRRTADRS